MAYWMPMTLWSTEKTYLRQEAQLLVMGLVRAVRLGAGDSCWVTHADCSPESISRDGRT